MTEAARKRMENWIRERVALGHGCDGIYGDDGELQCNNRLRHGELLDFRRMPMEKVFEVDARCSLEAAATYLNEREALQQALQGLADALNLIVTGFSHGWEFSITDEQLETCQAALDAAQPFLESK